MATRTLSVKSVIDAGAALAREKGLPALGVRALAARLKVTPMALYRHLPDGDALSSAVLDALLLELPVLPAAGKPLDQLRAWATDARAMLRTCGGLAHHLLLHWFELPRALEVVESLLGAAEQLGFKGFEAVAASNAVFTYVLMRVQLEESLRKANVLQRKLPALRGLPRLAKNAAEYRVARVDAHFEYGLNLLIEGLDRRS
jgi:AcrR family transcriptional regulator